MAKTQNLQDSFLNQARRSGTPLTIFLSNGFQMRGTVISFDGFTVLVETEGKQQLIYKHVISTLVPAHPIQVSFQEEGEAS